MAPSLRLLPIQMGDINVTRKDPGDLADRGAGQKGEGVSHESVVKEYERDTIRTERIHGGGKTDAP